MGKFVSVIIGAIVALLGLVGLIKWWGDFLIMVRGSIPAMLIFGGIIAVIAGLSEIRDEMAAKSGEEKK